LLVSGMSWTWSLALSLSRPEARIVVVSGHSSISAVFHPITLASRH
jgi:hypothetical protein